MADNEDKEGTAPDSESKKMFCMSKEMIPCKLMFLTMDACMLSGFAFLSLFYISSGLSVAQVGLSNSIVSTLSLISSPIWGALIDSMKKHRTLFFTAMVLASTSLEFSKPWVVTFVSKTKFVCVNTTILNSSVVRPMANCTSKAQLSNPNALFSAVTGVGIFASVAFTGMMCYIETAIIKTVFTRKKVYTYGEQKVFGPIGAGIGVFLAGVAVDHWKPKGFSPYIAAFFLHVPLSLLMLPFLYILTKQANWEYGRKNKDEKKISIKKDIITSFKKIDNLIFLISVLVSGITLSMILRYLFIYMDDVMKPKKTIMAMSSVISMMSELAIYPFSSKIIKFIGGQKRCIVLGIFSTALRLIILSYCTHPWQVLAVQPLHGVGMSLGWTAMIEYTWTIFPKEVTTTAIGFLVGLHWLAPDIVSSLVGGYVYHAFGGPFLFRATSIVGGLWSMFLFIYFEIISKESQSIEPSRLSEAGIDHDIDVELNEVKKG